MFISNTYIYRRGARRRAKEGRRVREIGVLLLPSRRLFLFLERS